MHGSCPSGGRDTDELWKFVRRERKRNTVFLWDTGDMVEEKFSPPPPPTMNINAHTSVISPVTLAVLPSSWHGVLNGEPEGGSHVIRQSSDQRPTLLRSLHFVAVELFTCQRLYSCPGIQTFCECFCKAKNGNIRTLVFVVSAASKLVNSANDRKIN